MVIRTESLILQTDFLVAYACGLIILILFCIERFNLPTNTGGSFIEALVPRAVSNGFQYTQTFVVYVTIMAVVYTGLSAVGPHVFAAIGVIDASAPFPEGGTPPDVSSFLAPAPVVVPAWVPLAVLVILTGGATHYRMLNQIEFWARRLTHRLIGIPQNVESLAANIRDRRINLDMLSGSERKLLISAYNQVTQADAETMDAVSDAITTNDALRRWLRLTFIHHMMEAKDLPAGFGVIIRQEYSPVWADINSSLAALRSEPEQLRLIVAEPIGLSGTDRDRRAIVIARVDETLHDLHALIAVGLCPVYKKTARVKEITDALRLKPGEVEDNTLLNRVLFALITLFFGVLFLVYLMRGDPLTAIQWASGAFLLHGAAALSAWRFYQKRARAKEWEPLQPSEGRLPMLQYLRVAWRGYLFGTAALVVWYVLMNLFTVGAWPQISIQQIWIPAYGAVGILTAFWVAYDFDIVHEQHAALPRKAVQVVAQAVTTAAAALFVTASLQAMGQEGLEIGWQIITEVGFTTAVAAGILGFIAVFLSLRPQPRESMPPTASVETARA